MVARFFDGHAGRLAEDRLELGVCPLRPLKPADAAAEAEVIHEYDICYAFLNGFNFSIRQLIDPFRILQVSF